VTKTSHSQQLKRTSSLQPWIRDHYAALRAEAAPRLQQTRAVVVPVIMDTSHKVRDEYMPAAAHLSSRVAHEAANRSAPLRSELSDRAAATYAAARGQLSDAQLGQLGQLSQLKRSHKGQNRSQSQSGHSHSHRKLWFIGGAAAAGAALTTAAVLWQRSRYQAWVEDDATQNAMDDTPEPERLNANDPSRNPASDAEDGDPNAHASSGGQHRNEQQ
jgi:hypothetical protein